MKPIETTEQLFDLNNLDDDAWAAHAEGYYPATPMVFGANRVTVAAWAEGCPTALPKVDYVVFTGQGDKPNVVMLKGACPWASFVEFIGNKGLLRHNRLCVRAELYPEWEVMRHLVIPMRLLKDGPLPPRPS